MQTGEITLLSFYDLGSKGLLLLSSFTLKKTNGGLILPIKGNQRKKDDLTKFELYEIYYTRRRERYV